MIPLTFSRWGQEFIGLIKSGYARDYLDIVYKPKTELIFPSQVFNPERNVGVKAPGNRRLWEQMRKRIAQKLSLDESQITFESSFFDDLGIDSLDAVELLMSFEEEYDLEITDDEAAKLITTEHVGDIL